jgi:hypothetical protein
MPLDIGESINYLADAFLKAPLVNTIASNPIYTAMMIVFILLLIVMLVFKDADTPDSMLRMLLSTGFWCFLATLGIVFLHDKILSKDTTEIKKEEAYNGVFHGSSEMTLEEAITPTSRANTDVLSH